MIEACLETGTHYLDITGEIEVFEYVHSKQQAAQAKERGVILCSGVGFDVIPTDCVARKLKELIPDATTLALGFSAAAGISPGTMKTAVRGLGSSSVERVNGKLSSFPIGAKRRTSRKPYRHCDSVGRRFDRLLHDGHSKYYDLGSCTDSGRLCCSRFVMVQPDSRKRGRAGTLAPLCRRKRIGTRRGCT